jgi:CheY-like chemotaxis protein
VLRDLAREILEGQGYRVLTAADGEAAVRVFSEKAAQVQLLLLDMVMPRMNGRQVFQQTQALRPGGKVLFMTGHTADAIAQRDLLTPGMNVLAKPFSPSALLLAVRGALDGHPPFPAARPL